MLQGHRTVQGVILLGIHAKKPESNVSVLMNPKRKCIIVSLRILCGELASNIPGGFLGELTGKIQWGFGPNLWPQGTVQQLDNWQWQIHNPNVVLRSIDQVSLAMVSEPNDCDKTKLDDTERQFGQFSEIDSSDDNIMWKDLLDSYVSLSV
jgi:hypothetical protein